MPWTDISDYNDGMMIGAYNMNRFVRDNERHLYYQAMPRRAEFWHESSVITSGNSPALAINTAAFFNYYAYQNPAANGDAFTQSAVLGEGAYRFATYYYQNIDGGILVARINGEYITAINFYAAAPGVQVSTVGPVYVRESKRHTFTFTIEGKSGASTDYRAYISGMAMYPDSSYTGDA
jgi:hypothetical protein